MTALYCTSSMTFSLRDHQRWKFINLSHFFTKRSPFFILNISMAHISFRDGNGPGSSPARPEAFLEKPEKAQKIFWLFGLFWAAIVLRSKTTSVPSERVFSQAGEVLHQKRNRLTSDNARMLICLHANLL